MRTLILVVLVAVACLASAQKEVEITFQSGDAMIAGTLFLPAGPGPHPAMVSVHGSGGGVRDDKFYRLDIDLFTKNGVAVLLYDKRGSGKSTGKYDTTYGLDPIVDDVLAAAAALRKRSEINPRRVGLKGVSEGGWVVARAGAKDPSLAFVVSVSGPGVSAIDQGIYQRGQILLDHGVSLQTVAKVNALRRIVWGYYSTGKGYEAARDAWDAAKKEPWFLEGKLNPEANVTAPDVLAKPENGFYRNANVDMVPIIASLKVPVLAVFGAKDRYIPVLESVARWQEAVIKGRLKDATVLVFENGGHGINKVEEEFAPVVTGDAHQEKMRQMTFELVDSYRELLVAWVRERVGLAKRQ